MSTNTMGLLVYSTRITENAVKPLPMKFIVPEASDLYSAGKSN